MEKVAVLEKSGAVVLVETLQRADPLRVYVPADVLVAEAEETWVEAIELVQGLPYGELWELLPIGQGGAEAIAAELRKRGIWTVKDLRANLNGARAAVQSVAQRDVQILIELLRSAQ